MRALVVALSVVAVSGCAASRTKPIAAAAPVAATVPLLEGTGRHSRPIAAATPLAQQYFDQGLNFLYAFNHDEAIAAFEEAARLDPKNPMPWWGVAIANGPHINNPAMSPAQSQAAWSALEKAHAQKSAARPVDSALIDALSERYVHPAPADRKALDQAYAATMRELARVYPDDTDVTALFAEAMMDLRPWDLWTADGKPQPGTGEIITTLEKTLARHADHPLANHLYIHAVEASPRPDRADQAAETLRDLAPGLGHLVHMPSHIDVRRGRWPQAITSNERAIAADAKYRAIRPRQGFYALYMAHNHHMLAYGAMMVGQSAKALAAIDGMASGMPPEFLTAFAPVADGFLAMPLEVRVRFGRWREVLDAPQPAAQFPLSRALYHYARGIAHAALGDPVSARREQVAFTAARTQVPKDAAFGNNAAADLLEVAGRMLDGEILARDGKNGAAIAALEKAVAAEDGLRYDEPPDWIIPSRHALGAVLLQAGRPADAEKVYREDLRRLPGNAWSLVGLTRSLKAQKRHAEAKAFEEQLVALQQRADLPLTTSCMCLTSNGTEGLGGSGR